MLQPIECTRQEAADRCVTDAGGIADLLVREPLRPERDQQPIPRSKTPDGVQNDALAVEPIRCLRGTPGITLTIPWHPPSHPSLPVATRMRSNVIQPPTRV